MDELWPNEEDAHDHGLLIMQEVADWLQSLECNNFWAPGARRRWQVSHALYVARYNFLTGSEPSICKSRS